MELDVKAITEKVEATTAFLDPLRDELKRVIVGQAGMCERLLLGILTGGHILLEGVPGLAKTLAVRTFAKAIDTGFQRIQFTPDLLPADLIGTLIYNPKESAFTTRKGPLFSNIILADEINRAPAKVQSALLEAMQERQVTIGEETFILPRPFLVLATQNPVEQEGTYPLPEAQVDRFMMKVTLGYPERHEERTILDRFGLDEGRHEARPVCSVATIDQAAAVAAEVYMDERIREYIVDIIQATRTPEDYGLDIKPLIEYGGSPRATICLAQCARTQAFLSKRGYVIPQDVKSVAQDVMRHRIIPSYEAEAENVTSEMLVQRVLEAVKVP